MEMSKAALPPRQPAITDRDRAHPLFPLYQQHRSACSRLLVEASAFRDWLFQYERELQNNACAKHARFPDFLDWMQANQGGARRCPAGVFPHNFNFWLEGGRW